MALSPAQVRELISIGERLQAAPHGARSQLAETEAQRLNISVNTLYVRLKQAGFSSGRKRRADAGTSCVAPEEALTVAAMKRATTRANGKVLLSDESVLEIARENGVVRAERIDMATGEVIPASISTLRRAVRRMGATTRQLQAPSPHIRMATPHPNHTWQIDASICVLYYLPTGKLAVAEADEFYKNKPNANAKVKDTVIRYIATDHYSGAFHLRYHLGGETAIDLAGFVIDAIQRKADTSREPFCGVPLQILVDPGQANISHAAKSLFRRLLVRLLVHKPRNARAKGQVEKHHDLVERDFEGRLPFTSGINDVESLNAAAQRWMRHFNATRIHGRHGHTRYAMWQTITADVLRIPPTPEVCRELMTGEPETRVVSGNMTVSYAIRGVGSNEFDVRHVPGAAPGERILVALNPYRSPEQIVAVIEDAEGREQFVPCDRVVLDDAGFVAGAPVFGERFEAMPDTSADKLRKAMDQAAWGGTTEQDVERARRSRQAAFEGEIDAFSYLDSTSRGAFMQRPGTPLEVQARVEETPLTQLEMLMAFRSQGITDPALPAWLQEQVPDGVPESELPALTEQWKRRTGPLRLVG